MLGNVRTTTKDLRKFGGTYSRLVSLADVVENNMGKLISFRMTLIARFQRDWVRLQEAEDVVDEFDGKQHFDNY